MVPVTDLLCGWLLWVEFCVVVLVGWYLIAIVFLLRYWAGVDRALGFWVQSLIAFSALSIVEVIWFWSCGQRPISEEEILEAIARRADRWPLP